MICSLLPAATVAADSALSLEQVRKLILVPAPDSAVAGEIEARGIAFEPEDATVATLRRLGAGSETTEALNTIRNVTAGAKAQLPGTLGRMYEELNKGNVRSLADLIQPSLLGDYAKLDAICTPGTHRAHLVEKTVEGPGGSLVAYVRALRQPVSERAYKLFFRARPSGLRLDDVDASTEAVRAWFQPLLTTAPELVRKLVWGAHNGQTDVIASVLSPSLDAGQLFRSPLETSWNFQTIDLRYSEIVDLSGLKVKIEVAADPFPHMGGYFVVENDGTSPRVVAWSWTSTRGSRVDGRDPEIESRTLSRFGIGMPSPETRRSADVGLSNADILMPRARAALAGGQHEHARALLDELLVRGGRIELPMARERNLGIDRWNLILDGRRLVLRDASGVRAEGRLAEVTIEGTGAAAPEPARTAFYGTLGVYVRLKLKGKAYSLYYLPANSVCKETPRDGLLSLNYFPQCDNEGQKQQTAVAEYLADAIRRMQQKPTR